MRHVWWVFVPLAIAMLCIFTFCVVQDSIMGKDLPAIEAVCANNGGIRKVTPDVHVLHVHCVNGMHGEIRKTQVPLFSED